MRDPRFENWTRVLIAPMVWGKSTSRFVYDVVGEGAI